MAYSSAMYQISIKKKALKVLMNMPMNQRKLLQKKMNTYAEHPESGRNVIKLRGMEAYRMRVGDWRIIFEKHDDVLLILVLDIGARGGIYQ